MPRLNHLIAIILILAARGAPADILISVATDKSTYQPGEALDFHITASNTATEPVTLQFNSGLQAQYNIDGKYVSPQAAILVLTSSHIPAQSSYTWTFRHDWFDHNLSLGGHSVTGRVPGYGDAGPVPFEVIAASLPTSGFSIDFDAQRSVSEYWPLGVRFRSNTASPSHRPGINELGQLIINSTTYPPGFNIAADFDIPVHGIAADVSAAAGVKITMIARDADGNILDSVTSAPVPAVGQFVPVSLGANSAIASVEWWPDNPQSGLRLDNVAISMPEPGAALLAALGGIILSRRSRRNRVK